MFNVPLECHNCNLYIINLAIRLSTHKNETEKREKVTKWINWVMAVSPMKYKYTLIKNRRADVGEAITPNAQYYFLEIFYNLSQYSRNYVTSTDWTFYT